jgi:hypothetical protein
MEDMGQGVVVSCQNIVVGAKEEPTDLDWNLTASGQKPHRQVNLFR